MAAKMRLSNVAAVLFLVFAKGPSHLNAKDGPPNIIFIIADDLGWNDVGFHGSNQIPTPNIDALAYNGIILNNYYVLPVCTPSRTALMTGKYPIHLGMQHRVLFGAEPRGLPLNETLLPQHLQRLGYSTHMVGKWHLGSYKLAYTPTFRGFESHLGFWTGHHDYYDHTAVEEHYWGLDMRRGLSPAWDLHGQYSTRVFAQESERIINSYNSTKPLFLYVAHAAVHSANPYNPLPAPDETIAKFAYINKYQRRHYAAMTSELDDSVGRIMTALKNRKMLDNTIIVFTTDNGGAPEGFNLNAASNWPLRGTKNTLWEGGVRGAALIWSPKVKARGRVSSQMMHMTDWLPTLYSAAGGDVRDLGSNLDGFDLWRSLVEEKPSERKELLLNIDEVEGIAAIRMNEWKIMRGTTYNGQWDSWYGPSGHEEGQKYDVGQVLGSKSNKAIATVMDTVTADAVRAIRAKATVDCRSGGNRTCDPRKETCLFNVVQDPCERDNLADRFPSILGYMEDLLATINRTVVPASNMKWDPRGDPALWGNVWSNFGDYPEVSNNVQ